VGFGKTWLMEGPEIDAWHLFLRPQASLSHGSSPSLPPYLCVRQRA